MGRFCDLLESPYYFSYHWYSSIKQCYFVSSLLSRMYRIALTIIDFILLSSVMLFLLCVMFFFLCYSVRTGVASDCGGFNTSLSVSGTEIIWFIRFTELFIESYIMLYYIKLRWFLSYFIKFSYIISCDTDLYILHTILYWSIQ